MEPLDLHRSFIFRQTKFGQNQFFDFSFYTETKSNTFIQSMATLQFFFNWFEQAGTWRQADHTPFSSFRFGNRSIQALPYLFSKTENEILQKRQKSRFRFWKRDKGGPYQS